MLVTPCKKGNPNNFKKITINWSGQGY